MVENRSGGGVAVRHLVDRIKGCKKDQVLILVLLGMLLLIIAIPSDPAPDSPIQSAEQSVPEEGETEGNMDSHAENLEAKLQRLLSHVQGIGQVEVMLTFRSDGKKYVEKDVNQSQGKEGGSNNEEGEIYQSSSSETTIYVRDGEGNEIPYVTEYMQPEIAGVLVIAQGADDPVIVKEITEAVQALFGVEVHKIKVMKKE